MCLVAWGYTVRGWREDVIFCGVCRMLAQLDPLYHPHNRKWHLRNAICLQPVPCSLHRWDPDLIVGRSAISFQGAVEQNSVALPSRCLHTSWKDFFVNVSDIKHLHSCCAFKGDDWRGCTFILIVLKTENTFGSSLWNWVWDTIHHWPLTEPSLNAKHPPLPGTGLWWSEGKSFPREHCI